MKKFKKVVVTICSVVVLSGGLSYSKVEASSAKGDLFDHVALVEDRKEDEPDVLKATEYELMVGNVRVTSENMNNIPGVIGKASYDPKTNTLYLENVTGIKESASVFGDKVSIISNLDDLTIVGSAKLLNNDMVGIYQIGGKLTVDANLTLRNSVCGIIAEELVINGGTINTESSGQRSQSGQSRAFGLYSYNSMTINGGTIKTYGYTGGLGTAKGVLTINGGSIDTCGSESAITFLGKEGKIVLGKEMMVAKPQGARVSEDGSKIVDAKGNTLPSAIITRKENIKGTVSVNFSVNSKDKLVAKVSNSNFTKNAYQWYRDGQIIEGETDYTYNLRSADYGRCITCSVSDAEGNKLGSITSASGMVIQKNDSGQTIMTKDNRVESIFKDVNKQEWYIAAVQYVYEKGYMNGTSNTTFEPNTVLTRAQFVTVLHNIEGQPKEDYTKTFSDVSNGKWFTTPVMWALKNEITSGVGGGKFGTDTKITREQLATMLYKYAAYKGYRTTFEKNSISAFKDHGKVSGWAEEAMQWAVSNGVMSGKGQKDGSRLLDPKGQATRAECAQMILNMMEKVVK